MYGTSMLYCFNVLAMRRRSRNGYKDNKNTSFVRVRGQSHVNNGIMQPFPTPNLNSESMKGPYMEVS